jgi:hypothetical protein
MEQFIVVPESQIFQSEANREAAIRWDFLQDPFRKNFVDSREVQGEVRIVEIAHD